MQKVITLRYASKCKRCGETIPAGSRAVWLGSKQGSQHENCAPLKAEIEKPKSAAGKVDRRVFQFHEIRNMFRDFVKSPASVYSAQNAEKGKTLAGHWKDSWSGCTDTEMAAFLADGYRVSGLSEISSLSPARPQRRVIFGEEGDELLVDLALNGDDAPFVEWEKRNTKPGLTVELHVNFNSHYPAATIMQYQRWIARMLKTLDENHIPMDVTLIMNSVRASATNPSVKHQTVIQVRKAGEAIDFANWSAMFSPGGFRILGIMAIGAHVDRTHEKIGMGYGSSEDYGAWTVAYDDVRNVMVVGNDGRDTTFPEFDMTEKLRSVLSKLTG